MYAPLAQGGTHRGVRLLRPETIERMSAVSVATEIDATLLMPTRFGLGFMRSMDNRHRPAGFMESMVLGRDAFGHAGAGGSVGFADPEAGIAFDNNEAHSAAYDTERTAELFCDIVNRWKESGGWQPKFD